MANPNLASATSDVHKTKGVVLTTSAQDIIPAMGTGVVGKKIAIRATNVGASVRTVTVTKVLTGPVSIELCYQTEVPVGGALLVCTEDDGEMLIETEKITALASANTDIEISANWVELS